MTAPWIRADYPSKKRLSRSEAMTVLDTGPDPAWFEPWITRGILFPSAAQHASVHGYVHVYGGTAEPFHYDVSMLRDRAGLSWGLETLHGGHTKCEECHGLYYFTPDEPLRLRMVIEADDSDDEDEADQ